MIRRLALLTLVVALALAACSGGDNSEPSSERAAEPAPRPMEVSADEIGVPPDLEIFMRPDATSAQIAAVRTKVETSGDIEEFAFIDQEHALRIYAEVFGEDEATKIEASELPASFPVRLRDASRFEQVAEQFGRLPIVDDVRAPGYSFTVKLAVRCGQTSEAELFLDVGAGTEDIAAIDAALRANVAIEEVRFRSQDEAFEVYECLAEEDPDFGALDPADLPASFELDLAAGIDSEALRAELTALPGAQELAVRR